MKSSASICRVGAWWSDYKFSGAPLVGAAKAAKNRCSSTDDRRAFRRSYDDVFFVIAKIAAAHSGRHSTNPP